MAAYFVTSIAPGQWFYSTDASPDAVISAPRGSVAIRTDAGNESLWINVTAGAAPGTVWERVISPNINGDLDLTGVDQITLRDNVNPALDIGSTGLLNLLRFITTNGAEQVAYNGIAPFLVNTGGINVVAGTVALPEASLNVASATTDAADGVVSASLALRKVYPAGAGPTAVVLPARVGGWRVVDAYIIANGAGATLQVFNGVNPVTNAMAEGGANAVTRAGTITLANATFPSAGSVTLTGAGGTSGGTVFLRVEPL
jgi:hypothetical protein